MKKFKALQAKRQFIQNKLIVGIDPAKRGFQAVVLDPHGVYSYRHRLNSMPTTRVFTAPYGIR